MFKPAYLAAVSLALAAVCTLPALANGPDGKGGDAKEPPERPLARPAFSEIDTNKDGTISQAEFDAFKPKRPDGPDGGSPHEGGPGGPRGHHHHFHGAPDQKSLDVNGDGKVTLEEFSAPMKEHFARLDTNHDGALSADELKAMGDDRPDGPPPPPKP